MARMYPEEYREDPESRSEAERLLYEEFKRQLDDRYHVFHRCAWLSVDPKGAARDGEIDFVIAREDLGVLAMEVKGGGVAYDAAAGRWRQVDYTGRLGEEIDDPIQQAVRGKKALLARLKEMPGAPRRWWTLGHALAFPQVAFDVHRPDLRGEIVLDRRDLRRIPEWTERALRFWAEEERFGPPGREGMELLTRLLGHSFQVAPLIGPQLHRAEQELARLTLSQFKVLDGLSRLRRVLICGCAGSGKTMLALEKARRLAEQGFRVLYACYNWRLRDYCRDFLRPWRSVTVHNFHGLCLDWTGRAGIHAAKRDDDEFWKSTLPGLFREALKKIPDRFDAVIADEGQDFDPAWWADLEALLADPKRGILYVFYDDNQLLYNERLEFPEGMVEFQLTENCRNTRTIHEVVQRYYRADRKITSGGPPGWKPEMSAYGTREELLDQVEDALTRFVKVQKIPPEQIAVLTGHGEEKSAVWRARRFAGCTLTKERRPAEGEIRWSSIHGFKGLEAQAVILAEIERLPHAPLERLLYVGCSRARLHLAVIAHQDAARRAGLEASPHLLHRYGPSRG